MNKIIIVAITAATLLTGCAGMNKAADADKPVEFVLDTPGKTKDQLFSASKSWIAETFVSGKSVIDDADKDSGRIIAKGEVKHPCGPQSYACDDKRIGFVLRIDTKEGKIRMTFTNPTVITPAKAGYSLALTYYAGTPTTHNPILFDGDMNDAKTAFKNLSDELQSYITKESVGTKNW